MDYTTGPHHTPSRLLTKAGSQEEAGVISVNIRIITILQHISVVCIWWEGCVPRPTLTPALLDASCQTTPDIKSRVNILVHRGAEKPMLGYLCTDTDLANTRSTLATVRSLLVGRTSVPNTVGVRSPSRLVGTYVLLGCAYSLWLCAPFEHWCMHRCSPARISGVLCDENSRLGSCPKDQC